MTHYATIPEYVFALSLFLSMLRIAPAAGPTTDDSFMAGSTRGIQFIFLGRCYDYLTSHKDLGLNPPDATDNPDIFCQDTWEKFRNAFAEKDICSVPADAYQPFFDKTGVTIPIKDKAMFWSGTFKLSGLYADHGEKAVTLAETFTGYLVTGLNWCGDKTKLDGINYDKCPKCRKKGTDSTTLEGFEVFWGLASELFAKRAEGLVQHLVTGTSDTKRPAFKTGTFFDKNELPYMVKEKVNKISVILANEPGKKIVPGEHCGQGSLVLLEKAISDKGIPSECLENPQDIMHLMCAKTPQQPQCQFKNIAKYSEKSSYLNFKKSLKKV